MKDWRQNPGQNLPIFSIVSFCHFLAYFSYFQLLFSNHERGVYFEPTGNFNISFLISKLKNIISCQFSKIPETKIWGHRARAREP